MNMGWCTAFPIAPVQRVTPHMLVILSVIQLLYSHTNCAAYRVLLLVVVSGLIRSNQTFGICNLLFLHSPWRYVNKEVRKVHPSLPKPAFFQGEQKNLVFSTYLYTQNLICVLQWFLCFVLPMSRNYSSSVCLCSKQQITIALVLSSGQPNVCFLFRLLPPCYIVPTRSLSLPPSAPCYLWKTKLP